MYRRLVCSVGVYMQCHDLCDIRKLTSLPNGLEPPPPPPPPPACWGGARGRCTLRSSRRRGRRETGSLGASRATWLGLGSGLGFGGRAEPPAHGQSAADPYPNLSPNHTPNPKPWLLGYHPSSASPALVLLWLRKPRDEDGGNEMVTSSKPYPNPKPQPNPTPTGLRLRLTTLTT